MASPNRGGPIDTLPVYHWRRFWPHVSQYLGKYSAVYIWRGQREFHKPLVPKLWRTVDELACSNQPLDTGRLNGIADDHLKRFKQAVRGRRGPYAPRLPDEELWALGRHHGLDTPLLDWTESPFVALYFAFLSEKEPECEEGEEPCRGVYGLNKPLVEAVAAKLPQLQKLKFVEPEGDENTRLVNQRGLFTWTEPAGQDIEGWIREHCSNLPKLDQPVLLKVKIRSSERYGCLTDLNRMNINAMTLFPDIAGAADHTNTGLGISFYG